MLNKLRLCSLLMTACIGSLFANDFYNPSNSQWSITGEYLYLLPSIDDAYFVIDSSESTTFPNGTRRDNDFGFQSGFRVGGGYTFCDCNRGLEAYYTRLQFKESKTIDGDFLWATVGRPDFVSAFENYTGSASSSIKYLYQRIDALYDQHIFDCCGLDFAVKFGLEAAELKLRESFTYSSVASLGTVHQHSKVWGVGPEMGFALGYKIYEGCDCGYPSVLSFNFCSAGSILAADCRTKSNNVLAAVTILDVKDRRSWRVIPAFHTRAGLNFDMCISCFDVSLEVGYEFSSYLRATSRHTFPDDVADGLSYNRYDNFDLQGLYVSATVKF